ncbi:MAG TPA: dihydrofolate reductase family protein [Acidimicrobiales bacterium]|nr:dihydrofolate reductase family protein [Acidimicrobiales bacterium]
MDLSIYTDAPRPRRPWVLANMVAGIDGSVSIDGRTKEMSSTADRQLFHHLRTLADVILVGAGTMRDEHYGPHRPPDGSSPRPIAVVTNTLRLDLTAPFFTEAVARPIIITSRRAPADAVRQAGEVADVRIVGDDAVDLGAAVDELGGIILNEGGPTLLAELLLAERLDELCLTIAPVVGGDPGRIVADSLSGHLRRFSLGSVVEEDGDVFLRYLRR